MAGEDRPPEEKRSTRGLGCLVLVLVGLAITSFLGLSVAGFGGGLESSDAIIESIESAQPGAQKKLVMMDLNGVIMRGDSSMGPGQAQTLERMLQRAADDDAVAGVLLRIDSPGGGVTASDILHDSVRRLRRQNKKIVVLMGDLCASGGYYIAVAADKIWAHPTTLTGSIGVLLSSLSLKALLDRHGIVDQSIVSGPNKQILNLTKTLTEEQRRLLQDIVDQLYGRFLELVAEGRRMTPDAVRPFADGRILTASQAKEAGLIDAIGYEKDALQQLTAMSGDGPFNVVRYSQELTFFDRLSVMVESQHAPGKRLIDGILAGPRAYYLYGGTGTVR